MDAGVLAQVERLVAGQHHDPHHLLGAHAEPRADGDGHVVVIRGWRPEAVAMAVLVDGERVEMDRLHAAGVFSATLPGPGLPADYRLEVAYRDGLVVTIDDPYRFWPTLGDLDLHLFGEGRHEGLWHHLGAHVRVHQGAVGTSFAVWAPAARGVRVVGDFNGWDGRIHPMRALGSSGVWELFLPGTGPGIRYKFEILTEHGHLGLRADPFAFATEVPPATASVVNETSYRWQDEAWFAGRASSDPLASPVSVYECHLGSWRWAQGEDGGWRPLTYRELAEELPAYVRDLGFTHVELLPVAEHPFSGSWGYQVTGYYAPTARFGSPDDFRYLVDRLHQAGVGVIVDWVVAHFPKDDWALARFDGSALYEHADPRQAEHPDWGTLVFNYGRHEVRNFLLANALYWIEEFHVDGLRVDAVASMLYLDYSRREGEWVTNRFGGKENLDAIDFVKETNEVVYRHHPNVMLVAEESTSWPAVSRPTYLGGLGFGFKWNMGWMNDTLVYFSKDPVHRRYHHHELTFALLYAFHENFILPLSHDEVVHGKGSLLGKMPGDRWQQFANLRALLAWMWAHPGRQLLFMGGELAQNDEWHHDRSLDWHLLQYPEHAGVQALVRTLNAVYRDEPALWERDFDWPGFRWVDPNDADQSVLSFLRFSADGSRTVACVANLTPVVRDGHRVGLPHGGRWVETLNSDEQRFGGSGVVNGGVTAEEIPWNDLPHSAALRLPPLGVLWLAQHH
ncbi:MAG TPA: 1,4-alpha-glucan branching protein GlgB [Frankiaceae bacterium]|nr:1,4-alpha-glucan branching protein GlgB [Frankiaceae bacterium]